MNTATYKGGRQLKKRPNGSCFDLHKHALIRRAQGHCKTCPSRPVVTRGGRASARSAPGGGIDAGDFGGSGRSSPEDYPENRGRSDHGVDYHPAPTAQSDRMSVRRVASGGVTQRPHILGSKVGAEPLGPPSAGVLDQLDFVAFRGVEESDDAA